MATSTVRWAFLGCVHQPITHAGAQKWAVQNVRDHQPDYIILGGDQLDSQALSSHAKYKDWDITVEWEAFRDFLLELREACPEHKLVLLDGNHEARIKKNNVPSDIKGALNWNNWLPDNGPSLRELTKGAITREYINRRHSKNQVGGTFSLGPVVFYHGYEIGPSAGRNQCKRFVDEWGLGVSCHTHRPEQVTQVIDPGKVYALKWYCNSGTLIDWENHAEYAHGYNIDGWGRGMVIGDCRSNGEGRHYYRSKQWEAEVLTQDSVLMRGRD